MQISRDFIRALNKLGAKPEKLSVAMEALKEKLRKSGVGDIKRKYLAPATGRSNQEALAQEQQIAVECAKKLFEGKPRGDVDSEELAKVLTTYNFTSSGEGGSHDSYQFPNSDVRTTIVKGSKKSRLAQLHGTLAALLRAMLRDEESSSLAIDPEKITALHKVRL